MVFCPEYSVRARLLLGRKLGLVLVLELVPGAAVAAELPDVLVEIVQDSLAGTAGAEPRCLSHLVSFRPQF